MNFDASANYGNQGPPKIEIKIGHPKLSAIVGDFAKPKPVLEATALAPLLSWFSQPTVKP